MMRLREDVIRDGRSNLGILHPLSSSNFLSGFGNQITVASDDSVLRQPRWSLRFGDHVRECLLASAWSYWFGFVASFISFYKGSFRFFHVSVNTLLTCQIYMGRVIRC